MLGAEKMRLATVSQLGQGMGKLTSAIARQASNSPQVAQ